MASLSYYRVGKGIAINGSNRFNFYGKDFNPTVGDIPSWETATAYAETSGFDLDGFQPGHEVGCYVWNVSTGNATGTLRVESRLQAYRNGSWQTMWSYSRVFYTESAYDTYMGYMYFGVDYDEIWSYATSYRIQTDWSLGSDGETNVNTPFAIWNLDIDSTRHNSGFLRVEGNHLCYTDASYSHSKGYKHKIAYDTGYSEYVGTSKAGHIRLRPGENTRICYVDANGYSRRTYSSDPRYGGNVNVGSSRAGYMWVSDGDTEDGYAHLCFIAPNGSKRRILNGPPAGHN